MDIADSSIRNYRNGVARFYYLSDYIAPIDVDQIPEERKNDHLPSMKNVARSLTVNVTSRSMAHALRKYFKFLSKQAMSIEGERNAQFFRGKVEPQRIDQNERDIESKVVSAARVRDIVEAAYERDEELGLMMKTMYETATRASGVINLLWKDFLIDSWAGEDLEPYQIRVHSDRSKSKESGIVEVSDHTLTQLKQIYREREPSAEERIFIPGNKRRSNYQKMERLFDSITGDETSHFFRHSRLTHMGLQMYEEEDLSYPEVKGRLAQYARHASGDTTETYIKLVKKKIRQKSGDLEKYRNFNW